MADVSTPAVLPLPGGRAGATVRLHPLLTGEVFAPIALLHRAQGPLAGLRAVGIATRKSERVWIPAPVFLIEHPSAAPLLVDTGLHPDAGTRPRSVMGPVARLLYEFRVAPEHVLSRQLEARGLRPGELGTVVMTHLHTDHAGGVPTLPGATFLVDSREWRAATARNAVARGYSRLHLDRSLDWRTIDYADLDAPACGPFDNSIDLFGDGSVRLLATPGHTPGHQSVLVRLREGEALLAADAAYTQRTIEEQLMPGIVWNEGAFRDSLARIRRYAAEQPSALIVPGHDPQAWQALSPVYN
ncbi:MAG: N-acyl homoserine lactonase family protein [Solirubrobacteraceae bacterium]|nr:MAG: hypothetical protein DLM63_09620 [Solirubrobacterales bacterium]